MPPKRMTDRESLLRSIIESPADDTPRLIFADWLDENGESERAAFVRVQVELARLNPNDFTHISGIGRPCECRLCDLRRRERELLGGPPCTRCDWHAWIPHHHGVQWTYHRGFVAHVTCEWYEFLAHEAAILREHPVERVRLTTEPDMPSGSGFRAIPIEPGHWPRVEWRHDRWPQIEFEMPSLADLAELNRGADWAEEVIRSARETRLADQLGLRPVCREGV